MATTKRIYTCEGCGAQHLKWQGRCPDCGAWNALSEGRDIGRGKRVRSAKGEKSSLTRLDQLDVTGVERIGSGLAELDRVLGGGFVPGSVVLIGGDPGIGKSTLLLSVVASVSVTRRACYVTGEESLDQIGLRAERLAVSRMSVDLLAETSVESIIGQLEAEPPSVLVIDSIQALFSEQLESAPGSVSQLRECAAQLVHFAKTRAVVTVLVGHVTKEGTLAGPRVLEHMVDTVLYFQSDLGSRFRVIRAVKNRFGAANELGFFMMTAQGFKEVKNPSAIFLARRATPVPGSITLVTHESTRPLLVEVQALVDQNAGTHPRRVAQGVDSHRLDLLLAVLHRHCGVAIGESDVFANVVGGLKIAETAADLPVTLALLSSFREQALPGDLVAFGEIGLTGEVRPVPYGEERLAEVRKHGFKRALIPLANRPQTSIEGLEVVAVERLSQALDAVFT